jgi:hypothetical protein
MKGKNALSDVDDCDFNTHFLFYIFKMSHNGITEQTIF